jgi:hypothetical protein
MIYRLTKHRGGEDNAIPFGICPIRDVNLVDIENQFGYTAFYAVSEIVNRSLEKRSGYLQALLFVWRTFGFDHLSRMSKNE